MSERPKQPELPKLPKRPRVLDVLDQEDWLRKKAPNDDVELDERAPRQDSGDVFRADDYERVPAGSPGGGQFAPKEGGDGETGSSTSPLSESARHRTAAAMESARAIATASGVGRAVLAERRTIVAAEKQKVVDQREKRIETITRDLEDAIARNHKEDIEAFSDERDAAHTTFARELPEIERAIADRATIAVYEKRGLAELHETFHKGWVTSSTSEGASLLHTTLAAKGVAGTLKDDKERMQRAKHEMLLYGASRERDAFVAKGAAAEAKFAHAEKEYGAATSALTNAMQEHGIPFEGEPIPRELMPPEVRDASDRLVASSHALDKARRDTEEDRSNAELARGFKHDPEYAAQVHNYVALSYAVTQAALDEDFPGKETITAYRGIHGIRATQAYEHQKARGSEPVIVTSRPASAWSTDRNVAKEFAHFGQESGAMLSAEVHKSSIVDYWGLHRDSMGEREIVVAGAQALPVNIDQAWLTGGYEKKDARGTDVMTKPSFDFQAWTDEAAQIALAKLAAGLAHEDAMQAMNIERRKEFYPPLDLYDDKTREEFADLRTDADDYARDDGGRFASTGGASNAKGEGGTAKGGGGSPPNVAPVHAKPAEFKAAFSRAYEQTKFPAYVSNYSEEELGAMKALYVTPDGKAGVAVHDHGDGRVEATALFNEGAPRGTGLAMLRHAIDKGGVSYAECYGPNLNVMYEKLGFKEASRAPFNPEYAAPNWNYARDDHPDYVTMKLDKPKA